MADGGAARGDRAELARLFGALLGGSRQLSADRLVNLLSLDKGWFHPADARRVVGWAVAEGVLVRREGGLAVFQTAGMVPLDYRPSPELAGRAPAGVEAQIASSAGAGGPAPAVLGRSAPAEPGPAAAGRPAGEGAAPVPDADRLFDELLSRLTAAGLAKDAVLAALSALPDRTRSMLAPEAALLVAAAGLGADVSELASEAYARLFGSTERRR